MKTAIVADGALRLRQRAEHAARLRAIREAIAARYAPQLAQAGPWRRFVLRRQMAAEFDRERRKLEPSPYSLHLTSIVSSPLS